MFGIDPGLKKALQDAVDTFSKAHNLSSIPWKNQKRPNEENVAIAESGSRWGFLPPCSKKFQELESEDAHVFVNVGSPRVNMNFKVIKVKYGNKPDLICEDDGLFYYPLGRLEESVL